MVTVRNLTTRFVGLGAVDTKPMDNVRNGSEYYEIDNKRLYVFDQEHSVWLLWSSGTPIDSNKVGVGLVGYMKI